MQLKLIQIHHKSRGRPPTKVRSREGPAGSKSVFYATGSVIVDLRRKINPLLSLDAPCRKSLRLAFCDLNTRAVCRSKICKVETGVPLARDWVNFTCSGKISEKPDGYNQIAVLIEMNHST